MVPLPTTAEEKFREAVYFFQRMLEMRTNVYAFPFNFSAFLAAARSITLHLQAQHNTNIQFQQWYASKQDEMRNDPDLRLVKDLRDEALHARKIDLLISQGFKIPEEGIVVYSVAFDTDAQGNMRTFVQLEKDGPDVPFESLADWQLQRPGEPNVLQLADSALRKYRALLDEWREVSS
jgi:hypothetical protein